MREIPREKPVPSYEWEELVHRLCDSDDLGLHDIGARELDELTRTDRARKE